MQNDCYDETMSFAKKLADLRKERDMSQKELGHALGVNQHHVSSWETGKMKPSFDALVKLAKFFNASLDYLVFENVPREGVEAINDFELYQKFRETEKLEPTEKKLISDLIEAVLFRVRVKGMVHEEKESPAKSLQPILRKLAERR